MSSSEEYLDSLLDSILSGGKSEEEESAAMEEEQTSFSDNKATDAGKAMSPDEIEEMLMSMGTLGSGEEDVQEPDSEEDMEAMLAFMNEHNADVAGADNQDDFAIDELSSDNFSSEDADNGALDDIDEFSLDDLSLDDPDMDESGSEDADMDELSLDDLSSDDSLPEELGDGADVMGGLSLDDLDMGEDGPDDSDMNELSHDDLSLDDLSLEETEDSASDVMDSLSLDDLDMGEDGLDDSAMDELSLDDLSLDDLSLEETGDSASDAMDGLSLDDLDMGESGLDDSAMNELSLDDLSLDDLSSDEPEDTEENEDDLMSEEDIDRLLNGDMSEETGNDFALEETGEMEGDDDLSALLAGMEHDEDLSEINDLLEESDQGISADDDMLAMLEGVDEDGSFDLFESDEAAREAESIRELSPEEAAAREANNQGKKEKKKRKKLFGRKKKGGDDEEPIEETEAGDELEALLGEVSANQETETPKKEKKPGFFAKLMDFLLESEEDDDPVAAEVLADNDGETGMVTDENKALLQELSDEDKKGKKKKKKKDKKGKKGKDEEEDDKKAKKEKKPKKVKQKKEKPRKKEEDIDLLAPPSKPLSKKKVITVFVFCATIAAGIIVFATILPDTMQKKDAHTAYDQGNYAEVYDLLYGKELDEQDKALFQGSNLVLQMQRKLSSYDNYISLDMRPEALNALITGVARYHRILPEAENYNVVVEVNDIYAQILDRLSAFGLSEQDALDLLALEDDVIYTQRLNAIISGESYGEEEDAEVGVPDMLPEEEEIMERIGGIDGVEGETELDINFEPEDISPVEDALPEEGMPVDQADDESLDEGAE